MSSLTLRRVALAASLLVVGSVANVARADEKAACIDAAEAAQKLRTSGKPVEARAELLKCTRDACPKVVRDDCTSWIAEVDKETPSVVVRARSPKDEDVDGAIAIDGVTVKARVDGAPIAVDPGPHEVKLVPTDAAFGESTQKVIVAAGEKNRIVTLAVTPKGQKPKDVVVEQGSPAKPASKAWIGWTLTGVGVASWAAFAVLQVVAQGEYSDMKASPCGLNATCGPDVLDPIRTKFVASGVLLGIGGAFLVSGVAVLIVTATGGSAPKAAAWNAFVAPTTGGAALGVTGAF